MLCESRRWVARACETLRTSGPVPAQRVVETRRLREQVSGLRQPGGDASGSAEVPDVWKAQVGRRPAGKDSPLARATPHPPEAGESRELRGPRGLAGRGEGLGRKGPEPSSKYQT